MAQKQRPSLSQSVSFPPRSSGEDAMQKSIDGYIVKTKVKDVQGYAPIRHLNKSTNSGVKHSAVEIFNSSFNFFAQLHCLSSLVSMFMTLVMSNSLEGLL